MTGGRSITAWFRALRGFPEDGERAQALVLFAAGLVAFCGFVGMSIDFGQLVYTRTDLQKAADAAALAAAQDLPGSTSQATADADTYVSDNISGATATVSFSTSQGSGSPDTVTVSVSKYVSYTFLKVIGLNGATPSASATAQAEVINGFEATDIAPYAIWGGSRASTGYGYNDTGADCKYHVCPGNSYAFSINGWIDSYYQPTAPDWTVQGEPNNYKGVINHGSGAVYIGDSLGTDGGFGPVDPSTMIGETIVIPIFIAASGNASDFQMTIGAWAMVTVNSGCSKQDCEGTVISQSPTAAIPQGWISDSSQPQPPSSLEYYGVKLTG